MHKRALAMTIAALCAAGTITIGTLAPASGDEGRKVQFTDTSPIATLAQFLGAYSSDTSRCTFNSTFTNIVSPCVVPVTPSFEPTPGAYNDTLTGDFEGHGQFKGGAILTAANDFSPATLDVPFESYEPYSVHVEGCGTGTLILHTEGNLNSTNGQWWIVPGSGRGDLTGISGNGSSSAPGPFAPAILVGHVRCAKHD